MEKLCEKLKINKDSKYYNIIMLKRLIKGVKKIVVAIALVYSFNVLVSSLDIFIPINYISVGMVSLLGVPGLLALLAVNLIAF